MPTPKGMAQRQVHMTEEMTAWFRQLAFDTRTSQQEHFRRALSDYRDKVEREASAVPDDEINRGLALARRFASGDGVDLEVLREADEAIWGLR